MITYTHEEAMDSPYKSIEIGKICMRFRDDQSAFEA